MQKMIIKREYGNFINEGFPIPFAGRWVVRLEDNTYVDHDKYFNDLQDRYGRTYAIEKIGV